MTPTLSPGQYVLIDPGRAAVAGDLVVARHPDRDPLRVIKRVGSIEVDGRYVLTSDNPEVGTDSRTWGPLNADLIEGTVTLLLDRPSAKL